MYVLIKILIYIAVLSALAGVVFLVLWLLAVLKIMRTEVQEDKTNMSREELRKYAWQQYIELKEKHPEFDDVDDVPDALFPKELKNLIK